MKKFIFLLLLFIHLPLSVFCGGLQLNLNGQRQLGMGNAGVGLALDAGSIFFNPGALPFSIGKSEILFGTSVALPATSFLAETPSIYLEDMDRIVFTPIYLYACWKPKPTSNWNKLSMGISINNPFGAVSNWPDDWKGKFLTQEFNLNTFFIQPTISYQVNKRVGIGAGFTYGLCNLVVKRAIQPDGPNGTEASAQFSGIGGGLGYNIGLYFRPNDEISIGISYRSSVTMKIDRGTAEFNVPESLADEFKDSHFNTRFTLPQVINAGIGYYPTENLLLAFDLNFIGWSSFDTLDFELEPEIKDFQQYPTRSYVNSFSFRMGLEYTLSEWLWLRGGVYYDVSPIKQGFVHPELPDANSIGLSLGTSIKVLSKLTAELTYVFDFTGERSAIYQPALFGGTYETTSSTFGIGIKYAL